MDDGTSYYDTEEVVGSYYKYHRLSCPAIQRIYRRNLKRLSSWRAAAEIGLQPCLVCDPYHLRAAGLAEPPVDSRSYNGETLTHAQLGEMRRELVRMLARRDDSMHLAGEQGVGRQIERMSRSGRIPRPLVPLMRAITEARNASEYEDKVPSQVESRAILAAWQAVQEWASGTDT
jgi:hypothetical protein